MAFAVEVRTTGCIVQTRVFLEDGLTQEVVSTPDGVLVPDVTLYPIAAQAGSWRLWGEATDAAGGIWRTGVVRVVTVQ